MAISQEECCRTCLSHCKPFTSISFITEKIPDLIPTLDFLLVKSAEIDKSPVIDDQLCCYCFEQIKNIHKFKEKCLESSKYLNDKAKVIQPTKIIDSLIKEETNEYVSIKDEVGFDQSISEDDDDIPLKSRTSPKRIKNKPGFSKDCNKSLLNITRHIKIKHTSNKIDVLIKKESKVDIVETVDNVGGNNDEVQNGLDPPIIKDNENLSLKSKTPPKRSKKKSGFCKDCNKSLTNIKRHIQLLHTNDATRASCTFCSSIFTSTYTLKRHIKKQHSKPSDNQEHSENLNRVRTTCEVCGIAVFQIAMHKKNVHGGLKFDCSHCGKTFKGKNSLKLHIEYTHEKPDLRRALCPHCGAAFRCNSELNKHFLQKHSDAMNYKCAYCERRFKTNSQCRLHERRAHLNIRKWTCSYCPNAFLLRRTLLNHIRTHTGERPFQCEFCSKSFAQKPTLTTHIKLIHLKHKM